jgi:hypothetical protein
MFHVDNVYKIPAVRVVGHTCKTNLASNTAFRGFGGPQVVSRSLAALTRTVIATHGRTPSSHCAALTRTVISTHGRTPSSHRSRMCLPADCFRLRQYTSSLPSRLLITHSTRKQTITTHRKNTSKTRTAILYFTLSLCAFTLSVVPAAGPHVCGELDHGRGSSVRSRAAHSARAQLLRRGRRDVFWAGLAQQSGEHARLSWRTFTHVHIPLPLVNTFTQEHAAFTYPSPRLT